MTEYVRFLGQERLYGEKHLLHGELGLLNFVKKLKAYNSLRQEEFVLRLALKKKIDEVLESFNLLDKLLPHDKLRGLFDRKRDKGEIEEENASLSLEQELEQIRRKLEALERK